MTGCLFTNNVEDCDDGISCTTDDVCSGGHCTGNVLPECECGGEAEDYCYQFDDGDLCNGMLFCDTEEDPPRCATDQETIVDCGDPTDQCMGLKCNPATGECEDYTLDDGSTCVDGNTCTTDDQCVEGVCVGTPTEDCECIDEEDPDSFCEQFDDLDLCNGTLYCDLKGDSCEVDPASVVTCELSPDLSPQCAGATCNPETGECETWWTENGSPCDDGVECTTEDNCTEGMCTSGTPNNEFCDDGDWCNGAETCDSAVGCLSGTTVDIDDKVDCTVDSCDEENDVVVNTPNNEFCDDTDDCIDGTCDPALGCLFETLDDLEHDGLCASDNCPTVWNPDNDPVICPPLGLGWSKTRAITLSESGSPSTWRRTNEPVEVPLWNGILDDSVVGYWKLDDGTATDFSGHGHHGIVKGPVANEGAFADLKGSLDFDGDNDRVVVDANPVDSQTWCGSLWFNPDSLNGKSEYVTLLACNGGYVAWKDGQQFRFLTWDDNQGTGNRRYVDLDKTAIQVGEWNHLVTCRDENDLNVFANGVLIFQGTGFIGNSSNVHLGTVIGGRDLDGSPQADSEFEGGIDEVVIFKRVLTPTEIAAYYDSRMPYGTKMVPGTQPDFDDVRVTEVSPQQAEHGIPHEVIGVREHSDTTCLLGSDDGTWVDRDDLCGVVAYWRLDGDWSDVGQTYPGTPIGGTYVQSRFGNQHRAFAFDGVDDCVDTVLNINPLDEFTVELWIKSDNPGMDAAIVEKNKVNVAAPEEWVFAFTNGDPPIQLQWRTRNTVLYTDSGPILDGNWHHVAVVRDIQGNRAVYFDGLEVSSDSDGGGSISNDRPIRFGCWTSGSGDANHFKGDMDDLLIHSVAKSPDYIYRRANPGVPTVRFLGHTEMEETNSYAFLDYALHWDNPSAEHVPPILTDLDQTTECVGLLSPCIGYAGWWRFNEGGGTFAVDSSTNKNNGSLMAGSGDLPAWVEGQEGTSLRFDGDASRVEIDDAPSLNHLSDMTIESWITLETLDTHPNLVSKASDSEGVVEYVQFFYGTGPHKGKANCAGNPGWGATSYHAETAAGTVAEGHSGAFQCTFEPSPSVFLDGEQQSTSLTTGSQMPVAGWDLWLGTRQDSPSTESLDGILDSVRIMSRALTPDEFLYYPMAAWSLEPCDVAGQADTDCDGYPDSTDCAPMNPKLPYSWADSFFDGDFTSSPTWTILEEAEPGWRIEDGSLVYSSGYGTTWGSICTESTISEGTWHFRTRATDGSTHVSRHVYFMTAAEAISDFEKNGYSLRIGGSTDQPAFRLHKFINSVETTLDTWTPESGFGWDDWHEVDIMRDADGKITVEVDGIHRLEALDPTFQKSNFFCLNFQDVSPKKWIDDIEVESVCCIPDCETKECGDNGCGASCGTCPGDESCDEGICNPVDLGSIVVKSTPSEVPIRLANMSGYSSTGEYMTHHVFKDLEPENYGVDIIHPDYYPWYSPGWLSSLTDDIVLDAGETIVLDIHLTERFSTGTNVALTSEGSSVSASGYTSYGGYSANPEKAFDGLSPYDFSDKDNGGNTFWGNNSDGSWLKVLLPETSTVHTIVVDTQYGWQRIRVDGTTDGSSWFTLVPETKIEGSALVYSLDTPQAIKGARLVGISSGAPGVYLWRYMISEFELWSD